MVRILAANDSVEIFGEAFDEGSGVKRVRVRVQRIDVSPAEYWDGTSWGTVVVWHDALSSDGETWSLPGVDLSESGVYRTRLLGVDIAGNSTTAAENPLSDFTVGETDTTDPELEIISPEHGSI